MSGRSKRAFDLALVAVFSLFAAPLMFLIWLAVRLRLGRPAIFRQDRPGLHGRIFTMYKFRTMNEARGPDGALLQDQARLTRLGRFLRRTSLDELPQLWNVLKGEMSLVGPRPLLIEYLSRYTPRQARRHEILPGITGWAQIHGRNQAEWGRQFELDVWYVEHRSLWLDVRILALTAWQMLAGNGVEEGMTRARFTGAAVPEARSFGD